MSEIELAWLVDIEEAEQVGLLAAYYQEVANGPMTDYRRIVQGGNKQGQNYYTHILDGINTFHKLRLAGVAEINDLEEQVLFGAFTIHDINKIPPYGGRDVKLSYTNIATPENIQTELERIDFRRFFPEWQEYLEDIWLITILHQHDSAPLIDLNQKNHNYRLNYQRLLELGKLMYAVDNLDLSHTLAENHHKDNFLAQVNAISERRWRWVTHRLGENRGLLSNLIHNTVVKYLKERHTHNNQTVIADLLYYPDGVAYLIPEREPFTWSHSDTLHVAEQLAQIIADKQRNGLYQLIKAKSSGIKVPDSAIESGASYIDILYVLRKRVEQKSWKTKWHEEYNQRLLPDIENAARNPDPVIALQANALINSSKPIVPLEQSLFKRGELALAYRNLLQDHLKKELKKKYNCDPWTHVYGLLNLPADHYALYNQVDSFRRGYFIARDSTYDIEVLFERMLADLSALTGEQVSAVQSDEYLNYLTNNLEIGGTGIVRDFALHLRRYSKDQYKQCCTCSSSLKTVELMESEVPESIGVQVFSNRLRGGARDPKRNVCPICRILFLLEKLTCVTYNRKQKRGEKKLRELYTSFYLHFYPYSFFTAPYLDAFYSTLKRVCHEDNTSFFLKRENYFKQWEVQLQRNLGSEAVKRAEQIIDNSTQPFTGYSTKVNGLNVPDFSEAICNTPTLPLNAPGENYTEQFLFALTQALMIADFFGCRVAMSRTPIPLLTDEYMVEQKLAFFVDGVPLNLRWLLPADAYRSVEVYRDGKQRDGGAEYIKRKDHWYNERLDDQGYAAYENIIRRLSALLQLSQLLNLNIEDRDKFVVEVAESLLDDPLSVYHIVDLTIEKKAQEAKSAHKTTNKNPVQQNQIAGKPVSSENLAFYLSKRVAPLLAEIVKE